MYEIKVPESGIDIAFLKKHCDPCYSESTYDVFKKYGYTLTGIGDRWVWDDKKLEQITELDYWKMLAIINIEFKHFWENECKENK
jgi:hypothetical protein